MNIYGVTQVYRLILIDDEPKILEGLLNLFPWTQAGFEVTGVFSDAQKAWDYLCKNETDVVISDIAMPHLDGIELAKRLQQLGGPLLIFISSFTDYTYFRNAIKYQVVDYLVKPIRYDQLMECMSTLREKLDREHEQQPEPLAYYEQITDEVKKYLEANYKDATLSEAAERVGLSPSYLSKLFKEKSGVNFSDMLLSIRMEKACKLLRDVRYKSYEIAFDVGYDNPKNFSRAFKAYFQISPSEYRQAKNSDERC